LHNFALVTQKLAARLSVAPVSTRFIAKCTGISSRWWRLIFRVGLVLDRTHAFADPNEADAAGIRLVLPTPEVFADVPEN
jgi:hypothetical protein